MKVTEKELNRLYHQRGQTFHTEDGALAHQRLNPGSRIYRLFDYHPDDVIRGVAKPGAKKYYIGWLVCKVGPHNMKK